MDNKEANLKALQENYKEQIKSLKQELGFKGDINNLLKENIHSEEYEFISPLNDTTKRGIMEKSLNEIFLGGSNEKPTESNIVKSAPDLTSLSSPTQLYDP